MLSVIRAYPSLPGPKRRKCRKEGKRRESADRLTSVEHTASIIVGMHMAPADGGGLWEEKGVGGLMSDREQSEIGGRT